MKIKHLILFPLLFISLASYASDGTRDNIETDTKWRLGTDFQIKLAKGLKLNIEPELRFNDGFDALNLNGGLTYRTFGCIYWGASYRLVCDREESASTSSGYNYRSEYDWSTSHRFAFDATFKDDFGRFTQSFRVRYNNYTDADSSDDKFMRYRAKVEYDIRKSKFTPSIYVEMFHGLDKGMIEKWRYCAEMEYKLNKKSSFAVDYKLDFYTLKYKNTSIFSVGYKCKL